MKLKDRIFLIFIIVCLKTYGQTIFINSITTSRQPDGDSGYTLDGMQMTSGPRTKLLDPLNFSSSGIYNKNILITDGFGTTGSLTSVSMLPVNNIFFFGAFNKLAFLMQDFSSEEIDSLYSWSLRGGKLIITTGGKFSTYYDSNVLNSRWGFTYKVLYPCYFIPTADGNSTDIFNGPFGNITAASEGGTVQGYFDTLTSNSKVFATDVHGNPTLFMDCSTLDLVAADVDGYTSVGSITPGGTVTTSQDKFWVNTIVFMDRLQPLPQITTTSPDTLSLNSTYNNYQWYLNDLPIDSAVTQNCFISGNGSYYVEVTVNGGCKVKSGIIKIGDDSIPLTDSHDTLLLPNVFTPDNDGKNDFFIPVKNSGIIIDRISIFNRWGNLIHKEDSPAILWDGKIKNETAKDGIYFWIIEYQNSKGIKNVMKGFLQLII